jgi:hypothetical protein
VWNGAVMGFLPADGLPLYRVPLRPDSTPNARRLPPFPRHASSGCPESLHSVKE